VQHLSHAVRRPSVGPPLPEEAPVRLKLIPRRSARLLAVSGGQAAVPCWVMLALWALGSGERQS